MFESNKAVVDAINFTNVTCLLCCCLCVCSFLIFGGIYLSTHLSDE